MRLTRDSPKIPPIKGATTPLKEHQLALIYQTLQTEKKIEEGEYKEKFLVLADLPGAGKTNVVLGHLMKIKEELLKENPYLDKDEEERDPTFIVVPQNILSQWIEAVNLFFKKKLKFKKFVTYEEMMALYKNTKMLFQYDIIFTTPLQYHMITTTLNDNMMKIKRVVFDEIDTISTMIQTKIEADFVWFVSASFKEDRIGTYYSEVSPEYLDQVSFTCEEEFIRQQFPLEDPIVFKYVSINKYIDEILAPLVKDEELRGMNALDYTKIKNDYFKRIPYHDDGALELVVEENRMEIDFLKLRLEDMKKESKRLTEDLRSDGLFEEDDEEETTDPRMKMVKEYAKRLVEDEKQLKEAEKQRDVIRSKVSKNRICMVCYQDIETKKIKIKNGEVEEEKEMNQIFRTECCKTDFCIDCVHYLFDVEKRVVEMKKREEELKEKGKIEKQKIEEAKERNFEEDFKDLKIECKKCDEKCEYSQFKKMRLIRRRNKEEKLKDRTSKIQRFKEILQNQKDHEKKKYIVFSDFYNTFRFIKDTLDEMKIQYLELDGGSIETIDKAVKEYREGDCQVLLSNSTFFGCGLNMEFTSDIIFMHKMEKGTERQVIGRAQRPGRSQALRIHYIFYDNEERGKEVNYDAHTEFFLDDVNLHDLEIEEVTYEESSP